VRANKKREDRRSAVKTNRIPLEGAMVDREINGNEIKTILLDY
jgi:hypothetical protein